MSIMSHPLTLKGHLRIRDALGFLRSGGKFPSWTPSEPVSEEILCSSAKFPSPSLGRYFAVTSEAKGQFSPDPAEIFGISFFSIGKGVYKVSGQWHIRFLWKSLFTCFTIFTHQPVWPSWQMYDQWLRPTSCWFLATANDLQPLFKFTSIC